MIPGIGIVLLAAGQSSRFGQPKQLFYFQGEALIRRAARAAHSLNCGPVVITTLDLFEEIKALVNFPNTTVIQATQAHLGQGASLKAGLRFLVDHYPDLSGLMILLCDQPLVGIPHLQQLIDAFVQHPDKCIAAGFNEVTGPPIIFPPPWFPQLASIPDNNGAKSLLLHMDSADRVIVPIPEAALDMDTPNDLKLFLPYDC
jgi:molybdenum cofactor cytidylyltransferase